MAHGPAPVRPSSNNFPLPPSGEGQGVKVASAFSRLHPCNPCNPWSCRPQTTKRQARAAARRMPMGNSSTPSPSTSRTTSRLPRRFQHLSHPSRPLRHSRCPHDNPRADHARGPDLGVSPGGREVRPVQRPGERRRLLPPLPPLVDPAVAHPHQPGRPRAIRLLCILIPGSCRRHRGRRVQAGPEGTALTAGGRKGLSGTFALPATSKLG